MKDDYGKSLRILLLICALVLLIACANIANLLLARSTVRRHQTSLQLALGASRQRLITAALTESVVACPGWRPVAGVVVAYAGTRLVLVDGIPHGALSAYQCCSLTAGAWLSRSVCP